LGYDKSLYSFNSRLFGLTIHCHKEINVDSFENVGSQFDEKANVLQAINQGRVFEIQKGVKGIYSVYPYLFLFSISGINRKIHLYNYCVVNEAGKSINVLLDMRESKNMLFSSKMPTVRKVNIFPLL